MEKKFWTIPTSLLLLFALILHASWNAARKPRREFYQLTVYHFTTESQEKILDNYIQNALIPSLHHIGIKRVGVFKSWANDTAANKVMYVFTPFESLEMVTKISEKTKNDAAYAAAASDYT